jgi:hypothetical protein
VGGKRRRTRRRRDESPKPKPRIIPPCLHPRTRKGIGRERKGKKENRDGRAK